MHSLQPDTIADVPSPIDLREMADARAWTDTAMVKRPWRDDFFQRFVDELRMAMPCGATVVELGSGPGFLAQRVLEALPLVQYVAVDFSGAMHELARERLGALSSRVRFHQADFKRPEWNAGVPKCDAVITMQAVHELRHKRHTAAFYSVVRQILHPDGSFLMADHFVGEGGMTNTSLFMTPEEHERAFVAGGFPAPQEVLRQGGIILYRNRRS